MPNPKTGRDVRVVFTREDAGRDEEWWGIEAYDPGETRSSAPDGLIAAGQVIVKLHDAEPFAEMYEPNAFVMRGGAGLCLYLAAALFAVKRGKRGVAASDTLSDDSERLWLVMADHGLARCPDLEDPRTCWLAGATVQAWIDRYRQERP